MSSCAGRPYIRTSLPLRALPLLSLLLRLAMQKWQLRFWWDDKALCYSQMHACQSHV